MFGLSMKERMTKLCNEVNAEYTAPVHAAFIKNLKDLGLPVQSVRKSFKQQNRKMFSVMCNDDAFPKNEEFRDSYAVMLNVSDAFDKAFKDNGQDATCSVSHYMNARDYMTDDEMPIGQALCLSIWNNKGDYNYSYDMKL